MSQVWCGRVISETVATFMKLGRYQFRKMSPRPVGAWRTRRGFGAFSILTFSAGLSGLIASISITGIDANYINSLKVVSPNMPPIEHPLPQDQFDGLLALLYEEPEDMFTYNVGIQLEFIERNGLDFGSNMFWYGKILEKRINDYFVPKYANTWDGPPVDERVPYADSRLIALQLRDYYRSKFGLAPLTDKQRADWHFDLTDRPQLSADALRMRMDGKSGTRGSPISKEQGRAVAEYMMINFPECVEFARAVRDYEVLQGYSYGSIDSKPVWSAIDNAIEACVGATLPANTFGSAGTFYETITQFFD